MVNGDGVGGGLVYLYIYIDLLIYLLFQGV